MYSLTVQRNRRGSSSTTALIPSIRLSATHTAPKFNLIFQLTARRTSRPNSGVSSAADRLDGSLPISRLVAGDGGQPLGRKNAPTGKITVALDCCCQIPIPPANVRCPALGGPA